MGAIKRRLYRHSNLPARVGPGEVLPDRLDHHLITRVSLQSRVITQPFNQRGDHDALMDIRFGTQLLLGCRRQRASRCSGAQFSSLPRGVRINVTFTC